MFYSASVISTEKGEVDLRKRIYEMIEVSAGDRTSTAYDIVMMMVIIVSLIPLAFKESNPVFSAIDKCAAVVFIIDYLLRLLTADYKGNTA